MQKSNASTARKSLNLFDLRKRERKLYLEREGFRGLLKKYQSVEAVAEIVNARPKTVRKRMRRFGILRMPRPRVENADGRKARPKPMESSGPQAAETSAGDAGLREVREVTPGNHSEQS